MSKPMCPPCYKAELLYADDGGHEPYWACECPCHQRDRVRFLRTGEQEIPF